MRCEQDKLEKECTANHVITFDNSPKVEFNILDFKLD